jgi:signal transduction histidine kinase
VAAAAGALRAGGGHGLIGMRERVILLGGDFDASRSNGTFQTHARIPYGDQRT